MVTSQPNLTPTIPTVVNMVPVLTSYNVHLR